MALKFQIAESPCIVWKTKLPRVNYQYECQAFQRGGNSLKFRLDCYYNSASECFRLYLINCNETNSHFAENLSVYVENDDKQRKLCYFGSVTINSSSRSLYYKADPSSFVLLRMETLKKDYGVRGDEISFLFIFDMFSIREPTLEGATPAQSTPLKSEAPQIQTSCLQTFSEDIEKLFGNTEYSDAVLKCGDKSFAVNWNILSARSEVFAAMFRNKLKERETGVIDIPNVEPGVMEKFLLYVYSGREEALKITTAFSLYQLGDLYAVPSLKQKCASFLTNNLSEKVVCPVLQLADYYKNEELMDIASSFVANKNEFMKSTTWITFAKSNPAIGLNVYMKLQGN